MKIEKQLILFGTGSSAQAVERLFNRLQLTIHGYTDNNQDLWGNYRNGLPIFSPEELDPQSHIVFIASMYKREIAEQLMDIGFIEHESYCYPENYMLIDSTYIYIKEQPKFPINNKIVKDENFREILIIERQGMIPYSTPIRLEAERYPNFIFPQQAHPQGEVSVKIYEKAYTLGYSGQVFNSQAELIDELSTLCMVNMGIWDARRWNKSFAEELLPSPFLIKLQGNVALTSTRWSGDNYYHWMFEELPRFYLLKKSGTKVEKFISNFKDYSYQLCSLQAIGVHRELIISSSDSYGFLVDNLIVPYSPYFDCGYVSTWVCDFLRETFLEKSNSRDFGYKRIYITRGMVQHRKVINEDKLIELLKSYDFKILDMGRYDIYEQANIFNGADIIIGMHGAALSNTVFCKPGAKLVEIFNPLYMPTMYWGIASQVGVDYYCSMGNHIDTHFNETASEILLSKDIEVDLTQIQVFLSKFL